ncbi:MAG TPA: outer membrane beta-barrel protein [Gemmatimonadales bacterium]|nr:outer membrane beta-barrel protein [Gemmatimonadales bacterium]
MKRGLILGLALALVAGVSSLNAQGIKFGVGGGLTLPMNNDVDGSGNPGYAKVDGSGFHGAANVMFPVGPIGIRVDGLYSTTSHKSDFCNGLLGVSSCGNSKILAGEADAVYTFKMSGALSPYVLGGVGMYNQKIHVEGGGGTFDTSATSFGYNLGAGIWYKLSGVTLFLEGRYVSISKSDAILSRPVNFIPFTIGVEFGGK